MARRVLEKRAREIAELRDRHRDAIRLANEWMQRTDSSQRGLAQWLKIDQSLLSRFLNRREGYEPCASRPRIMSVMESIEERCSVFDTINELDLMTEEFVDGDDVRFWARAHVYRLRQLRNEYEPGEALTRMAELTAQALFLPVPYKPYACSNTALTLSMLLAQEGAESCSPRLLELTMKRVDQVEEAGLESVVRLVAPCDPVEVESWIHGYAGRARGFGGILLGDEELVARGVQGLFTAVRYPHTVVSCLWHNALDFVEVLLKHEHPRSEEWALEAAELAKEFDGEPLRNALLTRNLSQLKQVWSLASADALQEVSR